MSSARNEQLICQDADGRGDLLLVPIIGQVEVEPYPSR